MTSLQVTADANILASGALRRHADAAPVRFIDTWRSGRFSLILSDVIIAEVEHTFTKPYFQHTMPADDRDAFLQLLRRRALLTPLTVSVTGIATHPEDDQVLATALSGNAQLVVTGDYKLVRLKQYRSLILVTVREFLAMLPGFLREQ